MKPFLIPCVLLLALSACKEAPKGRVLTPAECRELARIELEGNIKAGNLKGVLPSGREMLAARSAQLCIESGNLTTTYMACVKASKSPDEWPACKI
jgi:hypothetical protein